MAAVLGKIDHSNHLISYPLRLIKVSVFISSFGWRQIFFVIHNTFNKSMYLPSCKSKWPCCVNIECKNKHKFDAYYHSMTTAYNRLACEDCHLAGS